MNATLPLGTVLDGFSGCSPAMIEEAVIQVWHGRPGLAQSG
jgi:hypothetical protein